MNKRYAVILTGRERAALHHRVTAGRGRARELLHARGLVKADSGPDGPVWTDGIIVAALDVSRSTVERAPKRFAVEGAGGRPRAPP